MWSDELSFQKIKQLKESGASHIAGNLEWNTTYKKMSGEQENIVIKLIKESEGSLIDRNSQAYLIPIDNITFASD